MARAQRAAAIALAMAVAAFACGRLGFDGTVGPGSGDGPPASGDGAAVIDGGGSGVIDGGVGSPDGSGSAVVPCDYMNCAAGEVTCCVGATPSCAPSGACAGVVTECNLQNGQGCAGPGGQMCCPSGDGGAFCTPALCVP
jgi:hypothetical protein